MQDPESNASKRLPDREQSDSESSKDSQPLVARNYIQSLPIETLDHIFAFCYWDATLDPLSEYLDTPGTTRMPELDSSGEDSDDEPEPNHTLNSKARSAQQARRPELMTSMETLQMESRVWNEEYHPFGRKIFPYALAEVCPDWKLILLQRTYYWTRVVLSVDSKCATPLEDAKETFRITAPRFLEVSIGHYNRPVDDDDPELEKERMNGFIDLLQNLSRCREISIAVHSRASMPDYTCFEGHPRPRNGFTVNIFPETTSVTHSWCDKVAPRLN